MITNNYLPKSIMRDALSERHVQAIWYDGALRPSQLRTVEGEEVQVIEPGEWNLEAGPDFRNAILVIGGVRMEGDVEIHLRPSDWAAHHHVGDPLYANVIAHVTWYEGVHLHLPKNCRAIELSAFLRTRLDFSPDAIDVGAYPYAKLPATPRPCQQVLKGNIDAALELLRSAGRARLEAKAHRISQAIMAVGDRRQVFYQETLAALGYKRNSLQMRVLAERLPHSLLPVKAEEANLALTGVGSFLEWERTGLRPANTPSRRFAAVAALFAGGSPLDVIEEIDASSTGGLKLLRKMLSVERDGGEGGKKHRLIGFGRAAAIIANVVVPFLLAERRIRTVPEWLPPEDICSPMRLTAFRLFGRDHNPALYSGNGLLLQGLLHIHHTICLAAHSECAKCPFMLGRNGLF